MDLVLKNNIHSHYLHWMTNNAKILSIIKDRGRLQ